MSDYVNLAKRIDEREVILLDGAIGTQLQRMGVPMSDQAWAGVALKDYPDTVRRMHENYIKAGVDIITTNTYPSARHNLDPLGLADMTYELNLRGVMLAEEARERCAVDRPIYIAGSVSNCGLIAGAEPGWQYIYFPNRAELSERQARDNLREQAEILAEGGVDFLIAEPTGNSEQRRWVIEACVSTGLPVWMGFKCRLQEGNDEPLVGYFTDESLMEQFADIAALGGSVARVCARPKSGTVVSRPSRPHNGSIAPRDVTVESAGQGDRAFGTRGGLPMTSEAPSYDFIIVGAGSAGATLANRLSAEPGNRVLLLEAGPEHRHWRVEMPSALARAIRGPRFNWEYHTEPEPYLNNRVIHHPRGRVLGGSSSINGMMYMRGHARDYDRWAQSGCRGWSYADVLPYFKRAESYETGGDDYHGDDGPLQVTRGKMRNPLHAAFVRAGVEAGYRPTDDVNGHQQEGFGRNDRTTGPDGKRASTARMYLDPIRHRRNLTILTRSLASRVLLDGRRAVGVAYERNGRAEQARARREVILSGGAINSPQLLMLSGIGPGDDLADHGIEVVHELNGVGANLQDHPEFVLVQACKQPVTLHDTLTFYGKIMVGLRWFLFHDGLGATNHYEAGAFIRSRAGLEHPDLQIGVLPLGLGGTEAQDEVSIGQHAFSLPVDLVRPTSRGRLRLRSASFRDHPRLLFNYLETREDVDALVTAVKLMRELCTQPALAAYSGEELSPGPAVSSDTQIEAWLRDNVGTSYHPVSTCSMGPSSNPLAVVDPQLRVHGMEGLRVVDASIMPDLMSGNTNAPSIMIGEKGADLILGSTAPARDDAEVWIHPRWGSEQR